MENSLQVRTPEGFRVLLEVDGDAVNLMYVPLFLRRGSQVEVLDYRRVPVDVFDLMSAHPEPDEILAASRSFSPDEDAIACAEWLANHLESGLLSLEDAVDLWSGSDPLEPVEGGCYCFEKGGEPLEGVVGFYDDGGPYLAVSGEVVPLTDEEFMALRPSRSSGVDMLAD